MPSSDRCDGQPGSGLRYTAHLVIRGRPQVHEVELVEPRGSRIAPAAEISRVTFHERTLAQTPGPGNRIAAPDVIKQEFLFLLPAEERDVGRPENRVDRSAIAADLIASVAGQGTDRTLVGREHGQITGPITNENRAGRISRALR